MNTRRKTVSEVLLFAGVVCGIAFIFVNLYALPATSLRLRTVLLCVSIVTISSGLISYLLARASRA